VQRVSSASVKVEGEEVARIGRGLVVLLGVHTIDAAAPGDAEPLYDRVREGLGARGGRFGARMALELVNDGPVTLIVEV
jgi:D-Tyr-tRNAtyr deacylase